MDRKKINIEDLNKEIEKTSAAGGWCKTEIKNVEIVSTNGHAYPIKVPRQMTISFENVYFKNGLFFELVGVSLNFINCIFDSETFRRSAFTKSSLYFSGLNKMQLPLIFSSCKELKIQASSTPGAEVTFECTKEGFVPGFVFENCENLSIAFMKVLTKINLQFWRCTIDTNNLNDCHFKYFQMRAVTIDMELRLRNSKFDGIELDNLSAPWLDADPQVFYDLPPSERFGTGASHRTLLELSKIFASMRKTKASIKLHLMARQQDSALAQRRLFADLVRETKTIEKFRIRIKIFGNSLQDLISNRIFKAFYSPASILISGTTIFLLYTLAYWGKTFLAGGGVKVLTLTEAFYFSAITFCTVGYGDIVPLESMRFIAASEGFCGIVFAALFSLTLAKRFSV